MTSRADGVEDLPHSTDHAESLIMPIRNIPASLVKPEISQVKDSLRVEFYVAKLLQETPEETVIASDSEIMPEAIIFQKKDILDFIVLLALSKKCNLENLKVNEVVFDANQHLLDLQVGAKITEGKASENKVESDITIHYTVAGKYTDEASEYKVSTTDETRFDILYFDPSFAETVARYAEGQWVFD